MLAFRLFSLLLRIRHPLQRSARCKVGGRKLHQLPDAEDAFWRARYMSEPYFVTGRGYAQYQPAYALGWSAALSENGLGVPFKTMESELRDRWYREQEGSFLTWAQARAAVKAAWDQVRTPVALACASQFRLTPTAAAQVRTVLGAGYYAQECFIRYLNFKPKGFMGQVLARFSLESKGLLQELKAALKAGELVRTGKVPRKSRPDLLLNVWLDSGFSESDAFDEAVDSSQAWLKSYERLSFDALPAQVARMLKHQAMVIRGHHDAMQWLSREAA